MFSSVLQLVRDESRIAALRRYDILDTPVVQAFDDITRLATAVCGTPAAAINLIDADRQFFVSESGIGFRESSLDQSISIFTLGREDLLVIPDMAADPMYEGRRDSRFRYYAGAPLRTADGHPIGALCVLDAVPRNLTDTQLECLRALSRQVMTQLELRRTLRLERETSVALGLSEERFRAAFDHAVIGMVLTGPSGRIQRVNRAFEQIVGRSATDLIGRDSREYTHPADQSANVEWVRSVETEEVTHATFEKRYVRPDGSVIWVNVHLSPVRDAHGGITALLGIARHRRGDHGSQGNSRRADRDAPPSRFRAPGRRSLHV
jgi:PAS domain S-box-containing protein